MTLLVEVSDGPALYLEHLLLDVNGTLTDRGELLPGVAERLTAIREHLRPRLLITDTDGTLPRSAAALGDLPVERVRNGTAKVEIVRRLGSDRCAAIGNGANDEAMLCEAALGIAVLGPKGTSTYAITASDLVCPSILTALDLLADPLALSATLSP